MRADGGVIQEIPLENRLGGLDVGCEDDGLGFGVGEPLNLGRTNGELEKGDGVGEVDGGGTAPAQVVEARVDVGNSLLRGVGVL